MNRRHFVGTALVALPSFGALGGLGAGCRGNEQPAPSVGFGAPALDLEGMAAEYRRQLFEEYLPFWENGGFDEEYGGFICYLHDDGTVQDDRKDIWYQGRGIWVYSFLYNNIDRNPKWLDMARRSRDFMVEHMFRQDANGNGIWLDTVNRVGEPAEGVDYLRDGNIYGALFAAVGLIQYAEATGSEADLELAKSTIRRSIQRYEDPGYTGIKVPETTASGLRTQGHSFMMVWVVPQLLRLDADPWFELLVRNHLDLIRSRFWNSEFGISNETLFHDYTRVPGLEGQMVPGHSVETQWMCMVAAQEYGDADEVILFRERMRRLIEMSWDYVFGGMGDTDFRVFGGATHPIGPEFGIKAMWAQAEIVVGTLRAYADTREPWALDWYQRSYDYVQRTMRTDTGVWRQAVDRFGAGVDRPGISVYRKGNFHQPRCLMLNLLQIDRMLNA